MGRAHQGRRAGRRNGPDNEGIVRPMDLTDELLPGLPDDITLELVTPKLPWNAFHTLSSVSRSWLQAIQRRLPYDARVRSHSTETFVLHSENSSTGISSVIALYSMREKRCYRVPGIPQVSRGFPWSCECPSLDGKIYVIGGFKEKRDDGSREESAEVFVFDLAEQRQWKRCARKQESRENFGYGVLGGKIYVFGGYSRGNVVRTCEIFDPKENVWSWICPMTTRRACLQVGTFGEELFIYGGLRIEGHGRKLLGRTVEVYHSEKQSWTKVKPPPIPNNLHFGILTRFMAEGKFYAVSKSGIHVIMDSKSWEKVQSFSFPAIPQSDEYDRQTVLWKYGTVLLLL